jgi:plasmid stability protein
MATLNVKGFPDSLYRRLQDRARRERRSVAREVTRILADVLEGAPGGALVVREHPEPFDAAGAPGTDLTALRARLERVRQRRSGRRLTDDLNDLARGCAALPVVDPRAADEILGYDDNGLPR